MPCVTAPAALTSLPRVTARHQWCDGLHELQQLRLQLTALEISQPRGAVRLQARLRGAPTKGCGSRHRGRGCPALTRGLKFDP